MTTCPKCHSKVASRRRACPQCGIQLRRNVSGIVKTSIVMISADGEEALYRSVREVPDHLRRKLMATTAGDHSGTIVIADRAGKEQLTQVLARHDARREMSLLRPVAAPAPARFSRTRWLGFLLILALAGIVSAFFPDFAAKIGP